MTKHKVSVITTIKNEKENIEEFIQSIFSQTRRPDEVIVVDGGSTDGTIEILKRIVGLYNSALKIFVEPGLNISAGRNFAIKNARFEIIASVDGGATIDKNWLEELVKPLEENGKYDVSSGFFKPEVHNTFEKYLAGVTIPIKEELTSEKYLPSSRSIAFRKKAWEKVNGYPEWLPICEDVIYDIKLKNAGQKFKFTPTALSSWRPRRNTRAFFKQYFNYARGDGHAKLWLRRHLIRYTSYATLILCITASVSISTVWLIPLFVGGLMYTLKYYNRFFRFFPKENVFVILGAYLSIPLLVMIGDVAKMVGYPLGIYERVTGKIKFEEYKNLS